MIRDTGAYREAMGLLAARELSLSPGPLRARLRACAYLDARRRRPHFATRVFPSSMDAALARIRSLRAAYAALSRPGTLDAAPGEPTSLDGFDVGPAALAAFARGQAAFAEAAFAEGEAAGFAASIRDAADPVPADTDGFEARYLRLRFLRALDPGAHARLVGADAARARAAALVAGWWAERLSDAHAAGRAAFRARLAETVALTRVEEVDVDYEPDAWIEEALDEAGLPEHALDGCRKCVAWIHPRRGIALARQGRGGEVVILGEYRREGDPAPAPVAVPGPSAPTVPAVLDVAAFLLRASLPGATLTQIPGALAVAIPGALPEPTCLFLVPFGPGVRAIDDGRTLARMAEAGRGPHPLAAAGLGVDVAAGEVSLDVPALDGLGPRLVAMAGAIEAATAPAGAPPGGPAA